MEGIYPEPHIMTTHGPSKTNQSSGSRMGQLLGLPRADAGETPAGHSLKPLSEPKGGLQPFFDKKARQRCSCFEKREDAHISTKNTIKNGQEI